MIVERLARRCGYDAVAAAMPQGDKRLLSHIQKEMVRKKRTQSRAGSQVRDELLQAHDEQLPRLTVAGARLNPSIRCSVMWQRCTPLLRSEA